MGGNGFTSQEARLLGGKTRSLNAGKEREKWQNIGREYAKLKDYEHAFFAALYYGEGSKSINACKICNTDPEILKFFINCLRKYYNVPNDKIKIRVTCYLNNGLVLDEIHDYWCSILELPKSCIAKGWIKQGGESVRKRHKYGVCSLAVCDVSIVQQIFGAIKEYTGNQSDKWIF